VKVIFAEFSSSQVPEACICKLSISEFFFMEFVLFQVKSLLLRIFKREISSRTFEFIVNLLKLIRKFKECLSPVWFFIKFFASFAFLPKV